MAEQKAASPASQRFMVGAVTTRLTVTVPAGIVGGELVRVAAPDGSYHSVVVPAGLSAGQQFSVELLAGRRDRGRRGGGVALQQGAPGAEGVPPGLPGRPRGVGEVLVDAVGEGQEGGGVLPVAGVEQPPEGALQVAGGDAGRSGAHASLPLR